MAGTANGRLPLVTKSGMRSRSTDSVQSVRRAVRLLQVLADHADALPLRDVSKRAHLPPSTTHRLLLTLAEDSLVSALPGGYFRLGQEVARLGAIAMARLQPSPALHDLLSAACAATGETAGMLQLIDGVATVIDKVESSHPLRYHLGIGTRLPAHCTASGKALLAFASVEQRDRLLRRNLLPVTDNTITARDRLEEELLAIRTRGYAADNQEYQEGLYCLARPVRDFSGQVVYAVAISGPAQRFHEQRVPAILSALQDTTQAMEAVLGFTGNGNDR